MIPEKTAVVYCRANPGEPRTLMRRLDKAMKYLQENDLAAVSIILDESDDRDVNRKGMEKISQELYYTSADVLLMTSFSQFGRIVADTGRFVQKLESWDVELVSAENMDFTEYVENLMETISSSPDYSENNSSTMQRLFRDAQEALGEYSLYTFAQRVANFKRGIECLGRLYSPDDLSYE